MWLLTLKFSRQALTFGIAAGLPVPLQARFGFRIVLCMHSMAAQQKVQSKQKHWQVPLSFQVQLLRRCWGINVCLTQKLDSRQDLLGEAPFQAKADLSYRECVERELEDYVQKAEKQRDEIAQAIVNPKTGHHRKP